MKPHLYRLSGLASASALQIWNLYCYSFWHVQMSKKTKNVLGRFDWCASQSRSGTMFKNFSNITFPCLVLFFHPKFLRLVILMCTVLLFKSFWHSLHGLCLFNVELKRATTIRLAGCRYNMQFVNRSNLTYGLSVFLFNGTFIHQCHTSFDPFCSSQSLLFCSSIFKASSERSTIITPVAYTKSTKFLNQIVVHNALNITVKVMTEKTLFVSPQLTRLE